MVYSDCNSGSNIAMIHTEVPSSKGKPYIAPEEALASLAFCTTGVPSKIAGR